MSRSSLDVVLAYVDDQVQELGVNDPLVRADAPDAVHDMRVATRRLRSTLRTWTTVLDADATAAMQVELAWLSGELGTARDAEVVRRTLLDLLTDDGAPAAVLRGADRALTAARRRALAELVGALSSGRYLALLGGLDALVANPPLAAKAGRPIASVAPHCLVLAHACVARRIERAHAAPPGPHRDHLLHQARKAAKRARYAAELVVPVYGRDAQRYAKALERVQSALGDHQDDVVARDRLHELAARSTSPRAVFAYGRLHALERPLAEADERRAERAWRAAARPRLRAWFD